MNKEKIITPISLGLTALFALSCGGTNQSHPNVIIIYADDIGYGDFSCNGSSTIHTPNVDRLAKEGVRFTNAHSTSATSTPSRYGLLTGEYPWRKAGTGIAAGDAGMIISPEQYTMADMFRDAGYSTAAIGKWHLGLGETSKQDWNGLITPGLADIGFDYSFIMAATADRVPCVYIENQHVVNLDQNDPISVSYEHPFEGELLGRDHPELLKVKPSHKHDQAIVNGISRLGYMKGGSSALWVDEKIGDVITEKASHFIINNKNNPFFLYFGTNDIHVPRVPNERFIGKSGMGPRGDAILSFDYSVGIILDLLDSLNLSDNTIVILSSDNGPVIDDGYCDQSVELLGNHRPWGNYRGTKYSAYEAGTRVPMIVRYPHHTKEGTVSNSLISHIDIFRSLCKISGGSIPKGSAPDSKELYSAFIGKNTGREYILEQNLSNTISIVKDGWKYIEHSTSESYITAKNVDLGNRPIPQLYNIDKDPEETNNILLNNENVAKQLNDIIINEKNKGYNKN